MANNFGAFTKAMPPLLNSIDLIHRVVGPKPLEFISQNLNRLSGNMVPVWSPSIPKVPDSPVNLTCQLTCMCCMSLWGVMANGGLCLLKVLLCVMYLLQRSNMHLVPAIISGLQQPFNCLALHWHDQSRLTVAQSRLTVAHTHCIIGCLTVCLVMYFGCSRGLCIRLLLWHETFHAGQQVFEFGNTNS